MYFRVRSVNFNHWTVIVCNISEEKELSVSYESICFSKKTASFFETTKVSYNTGENFFRCRNSMHVFCICYKSHQNIRNMRLTHSEAIFKDDFCWARFQESHTITEKNRFNIDAETSQLWYCNSWQLWIVHSNLLIVTFVIPLVRNLSSVSVDTFASKMKVPFFV